MMLVMKDSAGNITGIHSGVPSLQWSQVRQLIFLASIVGYGDIFPISTMGKCICVFMMFWGNFLISLIIVSLANLVEFDSNQGKAFFQINNEIAIQSSFHVASNLIKAFFRYLIKKKGTKYTPDDKNRSYFEMKKISKHFRHINTELIIAAQQVPIDILLHKVYTTVDTKLERVKSQLVNPKEMEALLGEVEYGQVRLEDSLKELRAQNLILLKALGLETEMKAITGGGGTFAFNNIKSASKVKDSRNRGYQNFGKDKDEVQITPFKMTRPQSNGSNIDLDQIEKELNM